MIRNFTNVCKQTLKNITRIKKKSKSKAGKEYENKAGVVNILKIGFLFESRCGIAGALQPQSLF